MYCSLTLFSLLGFSGVMIPFTLAGGNIANPLSAAFLVPFAISVAVSAGLLVVYRIWSKRVEAKKKDAAE